MKKSGKDKLKRILRSTIYVKRPIPRNLPGTQKWRQKAELWRPLAAILGTQIKNPSNLKPLGPRGTSGKIFRKIGDINFRPEKIEKKIQNLDKFFWDTL